jgi:hypothetical protein
MKNADMPAMPMPLSANGSVWTADDLGNGYAEQFRPAFGLTKREHFAGLLAQGIAIDMLSRGESKEFIAQEAISLADALLAALEKQP